MAKTLAYSGDAYTVNSTAKDIIWTIDNTNKDFKLKFETSEDYSGIGNSNSNYTVGYRDGNDLVLVTNFLIKKNNSVKSVKNTIKDYFTTEGASVAFYNSVDIKLSELTTADILNSVSEMAISSNNAMFHTTQEMKTKLYGSKKADAYCLFNNINTTDDNRGAVYDEAGNDKYIAYGGYYNIDDFKGNDDYKVYTSLKINDYAGNDKYDIKSTVIDVADLAGNDSYDLSTYSDNSHITDSKGNDKYLVANSNNYLVINDYTGNDKYEILSAKAHIYEHDGSLNPANKSGNDVYNTYGSNYLTIQETSSNSGNDTYNITLSDSASTFDAAGNDKYNIKFNSNLNFEDKSGNDKYNIIRSHSGKDENMDTVGIIDDYGNDNYTLNSSTIQIKDKNGKDKYTFTNDTNDCLIIDSNDNDIYLVEDSRNIKIKDSGNSNDKYTFKNVNNINYAYGLASDVGGNDTYNIADSNNVGINDKSATYFGTKKLDKNTFNIKNSTGFNISVNEGYTPGNALTMPSSIDTYNITSSSGTIKDYDEQNDTYKVDKLVGKITIRDDGGDKDKLTISKAKADNIVLFGNTGWSDLTGSGTRGDDNSLYLYDVSESTYMKIENYFDNSLTTQTADGNGLIESIKVGGKEIGNVDVTALNSLQNYIAGWLKENSYMTIGDVLDSGNQTDINTLVTSYTAAG